MVTSCFVSTVQLKCNRGGTYDQSARRSAGSGCGVGVCGGGGDAAGEGRLVTDIHIHTLFQELNSTYSKSFKFMILF